jgi:tetratricopeptide (TPR) repeat protein
MRRGWHDGCSQDRKACFAENSRKLGAKMSRCGNKTLRTTLFAAFAAFLCADPRPVHAQTWQRDGLTYNCRRVVELPRAAASAPIVVTEFFTHGALDLKGRNLTVYWRRRPVSWQVLQVGPGDFCRVAFQTVPGETAYEILYGGAALPDEERPPWTPSGGLLLETRHWQQCDLNSLDSVRKALAAAQPFGSDFVQAVFHRHNPFAPDQGPFLSRYRARLQIDKGGNYRFFTSSQDCSFLLIDGSPVVAAPGSHGPTGQARIQGEVALSAGTHQFEYLHAAAGQSACMIAAWQPPGAKQPELIPSDAFGSQRVVRIPAGPPQHRSDGNLPDLAVEIAGDIPLESGSAFIRARFTDPSTPGAALRGRIHWDFGDGQTSEQPEPDHIYLAPGLYRVKITRRRAGKPIQLENRVQIHRAILLPGQDREPDEWEDYWPLLDQYDPTKLATPALLQFARAYVYGEKFTEAVAAAEAALLQDARPQDAQAQFALVQLIGPIVRDRLDDPAVALEVWRNAARHLDGAPQAECALEAADIALNDLLQPADAKVLLEAASTRLDAIEAPALTRRFHRLWGDWHARNGDAEQARQAYQQARSLVTQSAQQRNAWRGAYSRSAEAFLRSGELARARDTLRRWQDEFPAEKTDGYLSLLFARYWAAAHKYLNAVTVAEDLLTVNPRSPYADRLLYLAAESREQLGRREQALATFNTLVTDYPGSPLVEAARLQVQRLRTDRYSGSPKPGSTPRAVPR